MHFFKVSTDFVYWNVQKGKQRKGFCFFSKFLTDFVNWNFEKGKQGKNVMSSIITEPINAVFQMKMSGNDIEKDKKIESFPIFTIFVQVLSSYRWTSWTKMLNPLSNETTCCFSELSSSDCQNLSETFQIFVVFDAVSVQIPRDNVISSNTINNKRTSHTLLFLKKTVQRAASKTLQSDSK